MKKWMLILFPIVMLLLQQDVMFAEQTLEKKVILNPVKSWTITFNGQVDEKTIKHTSVYIVDGANRKIPTVSRVSSGNKLIISPETAYQAGHVYTLVINKSVRSSNQQYLKEHIFMPFALEEKKEQVNSIGTTSSKNITNRPPKQTASKKPDSKQLKVSANVHEYVLDVTVTTKGNISKLLVNGRSMHYIGNNKFHLGLSSGEKVTNLSFDAYSGNKKLFSEVHSLK
ncbi:Ig-like domain-containing protein [Peribacillus alkalitolerans]|uniref:Ig-like domain-containing protein n=1 Tax=Peribacillus alkalitolerans TaxID=1550385 RepID=UPI0013D234A9|nr:Ig-like domain-containing protein [Peribacillus alkalitolerans]